ncbi:tetratricopeptide repeat (TPR)-like superfamily protein isoform X2 [Tasmannia lanceolata]
MRLISLFSVAATRRKGVRSIHSLIPSLSLAFAREVFISNDYALSPCLPFTRQFATITASHNEQVEDLTRDSYLELEEKEHAQKIKSVIAKVHIGTCEDDVLQSLLHNQASCSIQPSNRLVEKLLQRYGDDWKSALGFFQWAGSQPGYKHTPEAYDKMVDILGKMKQIQKMWKLVEVMCGAGLVTLNTVAKVMRRLTAAGKGEDAIKTFFDLEALGLKKDVESMNLLLDALCKQRRIERARDVFLELKVHIPPNAHTFNIFVHGWCKANRTDEANWTILEMKGHGFRPGVITYSTILQAYCDKSNFCKVYELLDEMHAQGCPPNVVTYTSLINSLAKSEEIEEALEIFERMKAAGCKPDILSYNSLIHILGKAGQLSKAIHVFEVEMRLDGISPNVSTYNTMISTFCHHLQEQNALNVLREMEKSASCKPDLQTYDPLLKLCFKTGKIDSNLRELLSDMVNLHHLSLNLATYTLLIHGLCKASKCEWACLLFEEMISQDITPRYRTCRLLLEEVEKKNMNDHVDRIKALMKQIKNSSH